MNVLPQTPAHGSQASHERLAGLLERTDFASLSVDERAALIRSLDFPEFRAHLVRINGVLRGIPIKNRGHDYRDGLRVTDPDDPDDIRIDYRAPHDGWRFLEDFFHRMREEISAWSLIKWSIKLRYALFFAHVFSDGNKRTARYVQRLFATGRVDDADMASPGVKTMTFSDINKLAAFAIAGDELPQAYRSAIGDSLGNLPDLAHFVSGAYGDFGYAVVLEALALMLAVPDIAPMDLLVQKRAALGRWWSPRWETYEAHYARLQERLFWEVQTILDREMLNASDVDEAIHARVLGLLAPKVRP